MDRCIAIMTKELLTLEQIERREIAARITHFNGDKPLAAESLGISLKTLYNKLSLYAVQSDQLGQLVQFADKKFGCSRCGEYADQSGSVKHSADCEALQ